MILQVKEKICPDWSKKVVSLPSIVPVNRQSGLCSESFQKPADHIQQQSAFPTFILSRVRHALLAVTCSDAMATRRNEHPNCGTMTCVGGPPTPV